MLTKFLWRCRLEFWRHCQNCRLALQNFCLKSRIPYKFIFSFEKNPKNVLLDTYNVVLTTLPKTLVQNLKKSEQFLKLRPNCSFTQAESCLDKLVEKLSLRERKFFRRPKKIFFPKIVFHKVILWTRRKQYWKPCRFLQKFEKFSFKVRKKVKVHKMGKVFQKVFSFENGLNLWTLKFWLHWVFKMFSLRN